jgi:hypothetical protein
VTTGTQVSKITDELKRLFPDAWKWYVKDYADIVGEEPPKCQLDEMITYLINTLRENQDE